MKQGPGSFRLNILPMETQQYVVCIVYLQVTKTMLIVAQKCVYDEFMSSAMTRRR